MQSLYGSGQIYLGELPNSNRVICVFLKTSARDETTPAAAARRLTGGRHSVLPGGLVVAQGEQQGLDGADEDPCQAAVKDDVEEDDPDCGGEAEGERVCVSAGDIMAYNKTTHTRWCTNPQIWM